MRPSSLLVLTVSVLSALSEERLPTDVVAQEYEVILFFDSDPKRFTLMNHIFNGKVCIKDFIKSVLTDQYLSTYKNVEDIFGKVVKIQPFPKNDAFDLVHFWSCTVGRITSCISEAIQVYDKLFMNNLGHFEKYVKTKRVLNLVYTVLCTVLAEANASIEQDTLRFSRYYSVTTIFYKGSTEEKYLGALRCVRDVKILYSKSENIFNWIREEEHRYDYKYIRAKALLYLAEGTFTFPEAFKFFIKKTQHVLNRCKDIEDVLMDIVRTLAYKSDSAQLEELNGIIEKTPELKSNPDVIKAFEDGKEARKEKEEWLKNNESNIIRLIKGYNKLQP